MYIFKLIISISIIVLSSYLGFLKSKKLYNREYILRDFVSFLGLVKNEITYMLSILPNAYESSRQKLSTNLKDSIGAIAVDMLNINSSEAINYSIVNNISSIEGLTEYDKNVMISTFKNLGRSDIDGQKNIIDNAINITENQISEANEIKLKNAKMYKTLGIVSGLILVIVFI